MSTKIFTHTLHPSLRHLSLRHLSLRSALVFLLLLTVALPAMAQYGATSRDNEFRLRFGLFDPDGDSEYWQFGEIGAPEATVFTGDASDFEDIILGLEYVRHVGPRLGFVLGVSGWEGQEDQSYLFFEDQFGGDIIHTTTLDVSAITAGFIFNLGNRNNRLVPFLGAGAGFYAWTLEETGDFIDFGVFPLEIFTTTFEDDGGVFGWYWNAGVRIGITRNWAFLAEYRQHDADDSLSGDFEGFGDLDLSGTELSGGFSWTF